MHDLISFTEAAKLCPNTPKPDAVSRWRRAGIKTRSGQIVRLQCARSGKQYFTSELWLREFFNRVAELDQAQIDPPTFTAAPGEARRRLIEEGVLK